MDSLKSMLKSKTFSNLGSKDNKPIKVKKLFNISNTPKYRREILKNIYVPQTTKAKSNDRKKEKSNSSSTIILSQSSQKHSKKKSGVKSDILFSQYDPSKKKKETEREKERKLESIKEPTPKRQGFLNKDSPKSGPIKKNLFLSNDCILTNKLVIWRNSGIVLLIH